MIVAVKTFNAKSMGKHAVMISFTCLYFGHRLQTFKALNWGEVKKIISRLREVKNRFGLLLTFKTLLQVKSKSNFLRISFSVGSKCALVSPPAFFPAIESWICGNWSSQKLKATENGQRFCFNVDLWQRYMIWRHMERQSQNRTNKLANYNCRVHSQRADIAATVETFPPTLNQNLTHSNFSLPRLIAKVESFKW